MSSLDIAQTKRKLNIDLERNKTKKIFSARLTKEKEKLVISAFKFYRVI
ncbi:hypothetical protein ACKA01_05045 [Helcococcus kunzii]